MCRLALQHKSVTDVCHFENPIRLPVRWHAFRAGRTIVAIVLTDFDIVAAASGERSIGAAFAPLPRRRNAMTHPQQSEHTAWIVEPDEIELSPVEEAVCALLDLVEIRQEPCKLCGGHEHTSVCPVPALRHWVDVKVNVPDSEVEEWMRELTPN
jgi:hypothetical protein